MRARPATCSSRSSSEARRPCWRRASCGSSRAQKAPVVLGFEAAPSDAGTGLVVELSPHDALTVDDVAFGRVPPSRKLTTIISPAHHSPWFERALLADPDLELLGVPLAELGRSGHRRRRPGRRQRRLPRRAAGRRLRHLEPAGRRMSRRGRRADRSSARRHQLGPHRSSPALHHARRRLHRQGARHRSALGAKRAGARSRRRARRRHLRRRPYRHLAGLRRGREQLATARLVRAFRPKHGGNCARAPAKSRGRACPTGAPLRVRVPAGSSK